METQLAALKADPISLDTPELVAVKNELAFIVAARRPKAEPLSMASRVNEEDLYAAALLYDLSKEKPSIASNLRQKFAEELKAIKDKQGAMLVFAAVDRVMRAFVRSGEVSKDLYRTSRQYAFGKAQLDSDRSWLGTKKAEGTKNGDTALRALGTALRKFAVNAPATDAEIARYKLRVGIKTAEKHRAKRQESVHKAS